MAEPRVSIVIVNWKTPHLLPVCLDAVLQDRGSETFEIFVIDNNSGDESVDIVRRRYPAVKVIENSENVGFSRACNQAIVEAKGRFILLLNPDARVVGNCLSDLADFMERNPDCGAAGPKVLNDDGTLQLACRRAFPDPEAAFWRFTYLSLLFPNHPRVAKYNLGASDPDKQVDVDVLSGACMMVRHDVVDKIGLLDEDIFMFGEDVDWCWRVKQAKWRVIYMPEAVAYHTHGASSRMRPVGATINFHKGMEIFYRKHLAQKYWAPFNLLVYAAIWIRAGVYILLTVARNAFTRQVSMSV
jgi:GT2 family glycosyltransferase